MKNVKTMALALAAGVGRGFPDFEKVRKFCSADFSQSAQKVRKTGMKKGTVWNVQTGLKTPKPACLQGF